MLLRIVKAPGARNKRLVIAVALLAGLVPVTGTAQVQNRFYQARVVSVRNVDTVAAGVSVGQEAVVEFTEGPFAGRRETLTRLFAPGRERVDQPLVEGMRLIVRVSGPPGGERFHFHDLVRWRGIAVLVSLFVVLVLAVGGRQGVRTLASLALTAAVVFLVMIPLFRDGFSPVLIAGISSMSIAAIVLFVIGGINRKTVSALAGTAAGVLVAGVLAFFVGNAVYLTGFGEVTFSAGLGTGDGQLLMLEGDSTPDIRGLLFAGMIVGAIGAVTDVGMSIASATREIRLANPQVKFVPLIRSAMVVGRDIMGTMTNTLILAYVGGSLTLLLVFSHYGVGWFRVLNMDIIATELVRGLAGSIGLLVTIPVTACTSAVLETRFLPHFFKADRIRTS